MSSGEGLTATTVGVDWTPVERRVAFTPRKITMAPEKAFDLDHNTVWLHFCSLVPTVPLSRCLLGAFVVWEPTFYMEFLC
jgi:hypothetical protein